jgi:outer membrane receptor for ferrienterochelin and colicins
MWCFFRRRGAQRLCLTFLASLLAAALVLPATARADGTADEADAHFRLGMEDYRKGAYDSALTHFLQSNRRAPNRNVLFNIAGTYEAMARYADAYRYYAEALQGETDAAQRAAVEASTQRIAAKVALIEVVTDPPGATIYADRKDLGSIGKAPRVLALPAGKHRVIAELEGHETRTSGEVELVTGQKVAVSLSLPKIVGKVRVAAGAKGAEVRVDREDGPAACLAPGEIELPPGRHELWLRAPGHEPLSRSVVVEPQRTSEVAGKLVPLTGTLVVEAEERDATVYVDGKAVGFAPLVAPSVPVGERRVRVELRGFEPVERTVTIQPNRQAELRGLVLSPLRQVIAASRALQDVDDAPSSVTILDRRELDAFGYPTIGDAVRGVRGVVLSHDRVYSAIGARGTSQLQDYGNRILMLSDGHPLNEGLSSGAPVDQAGRVDLHDVERIEVVRGPGSLLYGTGAFGGLVNLVTRPTDVPAAVHAEAGVYDDHVLHGRAGFQYNAGRGRSIWASVQAAYSNGFDVNVPDPAAPLVQRVARRVESFSSQGTAGRATWGALTAQWFFHRREILATMGQFGTEFDGRRSSFSDTRFLSEARYEPRLSDRWKLLVRGAVDHHVAESGGTYGVRRIHERQPVTWLTAEARAVYSPTPWLNVTAGAALQVYPQVDLFGASLEAGEEVPYLDERHPFAIGSGYVLAEGAPVRWLRFSAGARFDMYSTFGPIVVPRAALIFKPADGHVLKVMGGRGFRAPSVFEQFHNDGGLSSARSVDEARGLSLGPESVVSGEVEHSARFLRDWVAVGAVHASWVEAIIQTVPDTPGSFVTRYANSPFPVFIAGGEVELRREWRSGWMLAAAYGYQHAILVGTAEPDTNLPNVPDHLASFKMVVPLVEDLASLGLRAALEAPRRVQPEDDEGDSDDDRRTDAAVVADLTLSGAVRRLGLRYTLGVYNIADWQYSLPAPSHPSGTALQKGRTFLFDVSWTSR